MPSYILFSQTSNANGQRNLWEGGGSTGTSVPGLIGGVATTVPTSNFDAPITDAEGATSSNFSLGFLSAGDPAAAYSASALAAALADGDVFSGPSPSATNPIVSPGTGFDAVSKTLTVGLADNQWNDIKNLEINLENSEVFGVDTIDIRNIVDVRIKLGDAATAPEGYDPDTNFNDVVSNDPIKVVIENAKRGGIQAFDSARALDLTLSLSTNDLNWQNSFFIEATRGDDSIVVIPGDRVADNDADGRKAFRDKAVNDGNLSLLSIITDGGNDFVDVSAVKADVIVELGTDGGQYFVGYKTVDLGFQTFDRSESTADQISDWLDDASSGGVSNFTITGRIYNATTATTLVSQTYAPGDSPTGTDFQAGFTNAAALFTSINDLAAATNPGDPNYANFEGVVGLGISAPDAGELFGTNVSDSNALKRRGYEINEWSNGAGDVIRDEIILDWDDAQDAAAAHIEVAVNYTSEDAGDGEGESVRVQLYNDGALVLDKVYFVAQETLTFSQTNGVGSFCVNEKDENGGQILFDEIRILGNETSTSGSSNDFTLNGVTLVLPEERGIGIICGGDIYYASQGRDLISYIFNDTVKHGSDSYIGLSIDLVGATGDRLTINGDDGIFTGTLATDLEINDVNGGATIAFTADPTGENIIFIADYTAAELAANLSYNAAQQDWVLV